MSIKPIDRVFSYEDLEKELENSAHQKSIRDRMIEMRGEIEGRIQALINEKSHKQAEYASYLANWKIRMSKLEGEHISIQAGLDKR